MTYRAVPTEASTVVPLSFATSNWDYVKRIVIVYWTIGTKPSNSPRNSNDGAANPALTL